MTLRRAKRAIGIWVVAMLVQAVPAARAQERAVLQLKQQQMTYRASDYYIADVVDDRGDKGIGTARRTIALTLPEGTATTLKHYLDKYMVQNRAGTPITMHITRLDINTRQKGKIWNTDADIMYSFYYGDQQIADMGGTAHTQSSDYNLKYASDQLQRGLESVMKNFGKFWEQNKARVALDKVIRINVTLGTAADKKGCIVYSATRPLQVPDFLASSLPAKYKGAADVAACTSSGIDKQAKLEIRNSQYVLDITVTPLFNKYESWFKPGETDGRVLGHEQNHFDITALHTCQLVQELKRATLTIDNYEQGLRDLFDKYDNAQVTEQDKYDDETQHGTIADKQAAWSRKLAAALSSCGCYH